MDKDVVRMYIPTHPDPNHSHTHTPNINTYHGILLSHKKKKTNVFHSNTHGSRHYHKK